MKPNAQGIPKAGLSGFDWTFVQGSTFVLRLNLCAKPLRLRQYSNRNQLFEHITTFRSDLWCRPASCTNKNGPVFSRPSFSTYILCLVNNYKFGDVRIAICKNVYRVNTSRQFLKLCYMNGIRSLE